MISIPAFGKEGLAGYQRVVAKNDRGNILQYVFFSRFYNNVIAFFAISLFFTFPQDSLNGAEHVYPRTGLVQRMANSVS